MNESEGGSGFASHITSAIVVLDLRLTLILPKSIPVFTELFDSPELELDGDHYHNTGHLYSFLNSFILGSSGEEDNDEEDGNQSKCLIHIKP